MRTILQEPQGDLFVTSLSQRSHLVFCITLLRRKVTEETRSTTSARTWKPLQWSVERQMKAGDRWWRPTVASRRRAGDGERSVGRRQKDAQSRLGVIHWWHTWSQTIATLICHTTYISSEMKKNQVKSKHEFYEKLIMLSRSMNTIEIKHHQLRLFEC